MILMHMNYLSRCLLILLLALLPLQSHGATLGLYQHDHPHPDAVSALSHACHMHHEADHHPAPDSQPGHPDPQGDDCFFCHFGGAPLPLLGAAPQTALPASPPPCRDADRFYSHIPAQPQRPPLA